MRRVGPLVTMTWYIHTSRVTHVCHDSFTPYLITQLLKTPYLTLRQLVGPLLTMTWYIRTRWVFRSKPLVIYLYIQQSQWLTTQSRDDESLRRAETMNHYAELSLFWRQWLDGHREEPPLAMIWYTHRVFLDAVMSHPFVWYTHRVFSDTHIEYSSMQSCRTRLSDTYIEYSLIHT